MSEAPKYHNGNVVRDRDEVDDPEGRPAIVCSGPTGWYLIDQYGNINWDPKWDELEYVGNRLLGF